MKISLASILVIILILQLTACNGEKNGYAATSIIVNQSFENTDEITVVYGDGNRLTMADGQSVGRVIGYLKSMSFEEVDLPETVGQNFTLNLSRGKELAYTSTGYLRINETLYKASDEEIVSELNDFVVKYGFEEIPGLLGGDTYVESR